MATKKQIGDRKDHLTGQLLKIRSIIGLCGFAAEARRTLHDIELAAQINPDLEKTLSRMVEFRSQWCEHDDNLGEVLSEIDFQLEAVIELVNDLEA